MAIDFQVILFIALQLIRSHIQLCNYTVKSYGYGTLELVLQIIFNGANHIIVALSQEVYEIMCSSICNLSRSC
jgi:hypothetical protein